MRVLVTGAGGFVGRWLTEELDRAGHQLVAADSRCDVTDAGAMRSLISDTLPDAIAHLAAIAYAPDAAADPERAMTVAVSGTSIVMESVRAMPNPATVLVTSSSEVYGSVEPSSLPLAEDAPLSPRTPYAISKTAQESVALAYASRFGLRAVVTRSFNHTGPGQKPTFVVPAMAERVRLMASGEADAIPVGNLDVRRDVSDVRDVVQAYRLLLEAATNSDLGRGGLAVNVCTGQSTSIRWIVEELCRLAGVEPRIRVDPELVRPTDSPDVRGDPSLVHGLTGWRARTPLAVTIADVWADSASAAPATRV